MHHKQYEELTVREFLDDEDFIRYVKFSDPSDVAFWSQWKLIHPDRAHLVDVAELQLQVILNVKPYIPSAGFQESLLLQINESIASEKAVVKKRRTKFYFSLGAVGFTSLAACASWVMLSTITITTGNGEFKSIELADATRIELSANSSLTFPRAYQFRPVRNVRLSGEAYFRVSHLARGESPEYGEAFTVNTDLMDVTVLGTEFNVRERRGVGQVALIKGGVVVKALRSGQRRTLRPGDIVKVSSGSNTVETEQKDAMVPGAWTEGKFSVNQTSVKDILTAFEDLYGYQVILDQPELANKKIDGSISIASEQGLLFTLSNILDVNVKKKGRVIRLEKRR